MTGHDYETLKATWAQQPAGQTADDLARWAVQQGEEIFTILRLLKDLYGLSIVETQSAAVFAKHGPKYGRPFYDPFESTVDQVTPVGSGSEWLPTCTSWTGSLSAGDRVSIQPDAGKASEHSVRAIQLERHPSRLMLTLVGTGDDLHPLVGARLTGGR